MQECLKMESFPQETYIPVEPDGLNLQAKAPCDLFIQVASE